MKRRIESCVFVGAKYKISFQGFREDFSESDPADFRSHLRHYFCWRGLGEVAELSVLGEEKESRQFTFKTPPVMRFYAGIADKRCSESLEKSIFAFCQKQKMLFLDLEQTLFAEKLIDLFAESLIIHRMNLKSDEVPQIALNWFDIDGLRQIGLSVDSLVFDLR